jgi:phage terminase large subunit
MDQIVNYKYEPVFTTTDRYIILMGGRSAGRSFVASQYATAKMRDTSEYFRCAIMRFILGDVKKSIHQEIADRIEEGEYKDVTVGNLNFHCGGNMIQGLGFRKSQGEQKSKLKSLASYNCVIVEEADEVSEEDFQQLDDSIRTMKSDIKIILLLNPPNKDHWIIKRWFNLVESKERPGFYQPELKKSIDDTTYIHTTYRDNIENINESTLKNFERYKEAKPDHHASMIDGLVTEGKRGRIFTDWKPISKEEYDKLDHDPFYGLDFGFTNDPTALNELKQHNKKLYIFELIYETGLTNSDIAKRLETLGVVK